MRKIRFTNDFIVLLILSAAYLVTWTFVVPMFESPDEQLHWQVAQYIHDHKSLPHYDQSMIEGNQGPMYYSLIAPFASKSQFPKKEIRVDDSNVTFFCLPLVYQHCADDLRRYWPMRRARVFSALLGVFGMAAVYLSGLEVMGDRTSAFLCGVIYGFMPGLAFRTGNISNDGLLTVTSAIATYYLIVLLCRGFTWKRAIVAGLVIGFAFLTKINSCIFFPVLAIVLLWIPGKLSERLRRLWALAPGLTLIAPWLIRNKWLYGDVLAYKAMLKAVPGLIVIKTLDSPYFREHFLSRLFQSGVGVFGGALSVYMPEWLYTAYEAFFAIGLAAAAAAALARKASRKLVFLLLLLCFLALASAIQLNLTISQPQGRYLYAALAPCMILVVLGWKHILANKKVLLKGLSGLSILGGLYALFGVEAPAYAPSAIQTVYPPEISVKPQPVDATVAGPLIPKQQLGQTFLMDANGLSKIQIVVATWKRTIRAGKLVLHLRDSPAATLDLANATIEPAAILDNLPVTLEFAPIPNSAGKSYYVFMEETGIPDATPITVYISKRDIYSGGAFYRNSKAEVGDMMFMVFASNGQHPESCTSCN